MGADPDIGESSDLDRVYVSLKVEDHRAVYYGYWHHRSGQHESAPETGNLTEILEWACERTDDVLVRLDWAGRYWRVRRVQPSASSDMDLAGELFFSELEPGATGPDA